MRENERKPRHLQTTAAICCVEGGVRNEGDGAEGGRHPKIFSEIFHRTVSCNIMKKMFKGKHKDPNFNIKPLTPKDTLHVAVALSTRIIDLHYRPVRDI